MSDLRDWYRRFGLTTLSVARPLCVLAIVALALGAPIVVMPGSSHAALALSNDQADDTAPNGAPLSAETQRLFQAVRDDDLAAVQQAVLDGADILAVNADGTTAADLAETLNHFTITHFLRAYQAIEGSPAQPTTVVETEEPAPLPLPEPIASGEAGTDIPVSTPLSDLNVVTAGKMEEQETGTASDTSGEMIQSPPTQAAESGGQPDLIVSSSPATPVSEMPDEANGGVSQGAHPLGPGKIQGTIPEQPAGDYFSRLSMLNPSPEPAQPEPVAPAGQIVAGDSDLQNLTLIGEAPTEKTRSSGGEVFNGTVPEKVAEPDPTGDENSSGGVAMVFTPRVPPRKPDEDTSGESSIFASVGAEQPTSEPGQPAVDVPMLAEVPLPEFSQSSGTEEAGKDSFFAGMRAFDEGQAEPSSAQPETTAKSDGQGRNTDAIPQFEQIRAAVIDKLRRESDERSKQLADVRNENTKALETEDMAREQLSGSMNIQTELRAKQRTALTGTDLPPGYVPPPDGGTSGIRFLQRMGLYNGDEPSRTAEAENLRGAGLPSGSSFYDQPALTEAGENLLLPAPSQASLARKALAFVDSGYSAPPAGRTISTTEDNAVATLSQIARLFQSPNIGYPSLTGALPVPGTLPQPIPMQGVAISQPSSDAPLNSSDLALPPPMSSPMDNGLSSPPTISVPEIPVGQAELAQVGDPFQPLPTQSPSGWDVTATDNRGNVVAAPPPAANGSGVDNAGLTTQLSRMFDAAGNNAAPADVSEGGASLFGSNNNRLPIEEATGSWDVVSVQAAPTSARTLLGGAVVPNASVAVTGSAALSMGQSVVLGKAPPVGVDPTVRKKACIDKRRGVVLFCIEHIDWPAELQTIMQVDTVMYQGLNAIVRYDNGVATRFHALFPSESFNTIVSYYMQRYGKPTNVWRRTIAPLAAPERENPVVSWQALNPLTQTTSTLEVRQYDDTRGGFPDEKRGAVTLYSAQSGPIFPQVSAFELMRLHPGP